MCSTNGSAGHERDLDTKQILEKFPEADNRTPPPPPSIAITTAPEDLPDAGLRSLDHCMSGASAKFSTRFHVHR